MANSISPLGVVLAGGASSRMGLEKATLRIDGLALAERAARKLAAAGCDVIVADRGRRTVAGLSSVADGEGKGPAAGILGAAASFPGRELLVLACDLPLVPAQLLTALRRQTEADWVVPRWERGLEPLAALYRPAALEALREQTAAGQLAPSRLAGTTGLAIHFFEGDVLAKFGPPAQIFLNLNRVEDLEHLEALRARADAALHPRFAEG